MANALSLSDLNTSIDVEPRILDVTLGERLGMAQPRNLRTKISANKAELESYGRVCTVSVQTAGNKGGRPTKAFYLNEPQAILLCMFANTPLAAEVRHQVITVFMAYRKGAVVPVKAHERRLSTSNDVALRLKTNVDRLDSILLAHDRAAVLDTVAEMFRDMRDREAKHFESMRLTANAIEHLVRSKSMKRLA